jgi:hypothetical protein
MPSKLHIVGITFECEKVPDHLVGLVYENIGAADWKLLTHPELDPHHKRPDKESEPLKFGVGWAEANVNALAILGIAATKVWSDTYAEVIDEQYWTDENDSEPDQGDAGEPVLASD